MIHRAAWVVVDPWTVLPNGFFRVEGGRVIETGFWTATRREKSVDHGPGALVPGLINAHTHLELSALHGRVRAAGDFLAWVGEVIALREATPKKDLVAAARRAARALIEAGVAAGGEVSTLGWTADLVRQAGLGGVWWSEYLGSPCPVPDPDEPAEGDLVLSLAGHAPHTTHPDLLVALKAETRRAGRPWAIHLAESMAEVEFLLSGRGPWADFLISRGISFDEWGLPAEGPVAYLDSLGLLDEFTLAVHLLQTGPADWEVLRRRGAAVCLCPRSNHRLHGQTPDWPGMIAAGLEPALGTDSLASVDTLSLWDEMAFAVKTYPGLDPAYVLAGATLYAARALRQGHFRGSLHLGRRAAALYVPIQAASPRGLIEALVCNGGAGGLTWVAGRPSPSA